MLRKVDMNSKIITRNLEFIILEHYFMRKVQVIIKNVLLLALETR